MWIFAYFNLNFQDTQILRGCFGFLTSSRAISRYTFFRNQKPRKSRPCCTQINLIFFFRMVTYAKSKIWIEKLLKCLADGNEEINFEILVRPLEPFLVCKETKAALSRQKIFILTKPALVKAFQVKFSFDF